MSCAKIDDGRSWTEPTGHSKLACARHWRATPLVVGQRRGSVLSCRIRPCKLREMAWHLHGGARACASGGPALYATPPAAQWPESSRHDRLGAARGCACRPSPRVAAAGGCAAARAPAARAVWTAVHVAAPSGGALGPRMRTLLVTRLEPDRRTANFQCTVEPAIPAWPSGRMSPSSRREKCSPQFATCQRRPNPVHSV